jgi:hypothetical protein
VTGVTEMKTWEMMFSDSNPPVPRLLEGAEDWYFSPPCGHLCLLTNHEIVRHEDTTVSASPSIVCPHPGCPTHGFLDHSQWRDA